MSIIGRRKGDKVVYGGVEMRVVKPVGFDTLMVVSPTGEYLTATLADLEAERRGRAVAKVSVDVRREEKIKPYVEAFGELLSRERRTRDEVKIAGAKLGISVSTAYEALARFDLTGCAADLPPPTRPGGRGKSRLSKAADQIVQSTIDEVLIGGNGRPRTFYRRVKQRLSAAGLAVSQTTLRDRVAKIPSYRLTQSRKGTTKARNELDPLAGEHPDALRPLAAVQIDHWRADVEILSDDRLTVIGRVWITLAIDLYSRMVWGLHVGLDDPSFATVGLAMVNGMTSKDAVARDHNIDWEDRTFGNPICGRTEVVKADNAGEFTGHAMQRSCTHYNVKLEWRSVEKPQYGAYIEALNRNLAYKFKEIPGATGSNPRERSELDPDKTAAFTLDDLKKQVWLMVDEYHNEVHGTLGMTPLQKYTSYFFDGERQKRRLPDVYVDSLELRLRWYPMVMRTLQRYGIKVDHLDYYSEALQILIRNRHDYGPLEVRRDPDDVRHIYVLHPVQKIWLEVPVRRIGFPPAALWELRRAIAEAKRNKREPTSTALGAILKKQQQHIEEAKSKTRSAQRAERRRLQNDRNRKSKPPAMTNEIRLAQSEVKYSPALPPTPTSFGSADDLAALLDGISDADVDAAFDD